MTTEPAFSPQWRATFGKSDPARTAVEVACLRRVLPLPEFRTVLDVACGPGRHLRALGERGYRVTGIDADPAVVAEARAAGLDARVGDMRTLEAATTGFDAVICMWASFGWFAAETNEAVLRQLVERLRPGGRLVLDVYHRGFFEARQGETDNRGVHERKRVRDGRLRTELLYPGGATDVFEWQLYTPEELAALARRHGAECLVACGDFDVDRPADPEVPRMQLVLERG